MRFSVVAASRRDARAMPAPPPTAEAFAAAVDRLTGRRGRVVVKLGGSAMEDPAATAAALRSVATLHRTGFLIALVHGGGKPIDRAMAAAGLEPRKVAGRRYTDDATLAIVVRVLHEINDDLVTRLREAGAHPVARAEALTGDQLRPAGPDGLPVDLGRVGRVTEVDHHTLDVDINEGFLPVLPPLARDGDGGWLNLNADDAAAAVAGALSADYAVFLTDTPGVLRDKSEPASLIPRLTEAEGRELIAAGVIAGGMIPKVEACFVALAAGAKSAVILDGRVPYSLLDVFLRDTFTGTEITR